MVALRGPSHTRATQPTLPSITVLSEGPCSGLPNWRNRGHQSGTFRPSSVSHPSLALRFNRSFLAAGSQRRRVFNEPHTDGPPFHSNVKRSKQLTRPRHNLSPANQRLWSHLFRALRPVDTLPSLWTPSPTPRPPGAAPGRLPSASLWPLWIAPLLRHPPSPFPLCLAHFGSIGFFWLYLVHFGSFWLFLAPPVWLILALFGFFGSFWLPPPQPNWTPGGSVTLRHPSPSYGYLSQTASRNPDRGPAGPLLPQGMCFSISESQHPPSCRNLSKPLLSQKSGPCQNGFFQRGNFKILRAIS